MHDTGYLGLVHWDDPEGWYGEGGGRRVQDIQSTASEQSARVMAMQAASDNAKELLDELQLEYNKLRQQGITTELLDILGGQVER